MSNLRLVHSADILRHPSAGKKDAHAAYKKANEHFLNNFPIRLIYDEGSHDVTLNVMTGREDRLKFIELEDAIRKFGAQTADRLCEKGALQIKQYYLDWEIVCLDQYSEAVIDPANNVRNIHQRRLQLRRSFVPQLNNAV